MIYHFSETTEKKKVFLKQKHCPLKYIFNRLLNMQCSLLEICGSINWCASSFLCTHTPDFQILKILRVFNRVEEISKNFLRFQWNINRYYGVQSTNDVTLLFLITTPVPSHLTVCSQREILSIRPSFPHTCATLFMDGD